MSASHKLQTSDRRAFLIYAPGIHDIDKFHGDSFLVTGTEESDYTWAELAEFMCSIGATLHGRKFPRNFLVANVRKKSCVSWTCYEDVTREHLRGIYPYTRLLTKVDQCRPIAAYMASRYGENL